MYLMSGSIPCGYVYLLGFDTQSLRFTSDLYVFDMDTHTWRFVRITSVAYPHCYSQGVTTIRNGME